MLRLAATAPWRARSCVARLASTNLRDAAPKGHRSTRFGRGVAAGVAVAAVFVSSFDSESTLLKYVYMPLIRLMDAEDSHTFAIRLASLGLSPRDRSHDDPILHTTLFNAPLSSPLGLAAGFDKHAEAMDALLGMGFSFIEVGSVTPEPQEGNERPRVFRLPEDEAIINRYGFNSHGLARVIPRLNAFRDKNQKRSSPRRGLIGVNLGKNKTSASAHDDYVRGLNAAAPFADFVVINVSSPNTANLRDLQGKKALEGLLDAIIAARAKLPLQYRSLPIVVKIAPDMDTAGLSDVASVAQSRRIDAIIIGNTTVSRPNSLRADDSLTTQTGGLSGKPLFELSTEKLRELYRLTKGKIPLIAAGGVSSGRDAYTKILAGATVVELYTSLSVQGPGVVPRVKQELAVLLRENGYVSVAQAVGKGHVQK